MAKRPGKGRRDPLFDLPQACADFGRACQLPGFTAAEGAALLGGHNQEVITEQSIVVANQSDQRTIDFLWRLKVLNRAIANGDLPHYLEPRRLVSFADEVNISVPEGFRDAVSELGRAVACAGCEECQRQIIELSAENSALKSQLVEPPHKSRKSFQIIAVSAASILGYRGNAGSDVPAKIADRASLIGLSITQPVVSRLLMDGCKDLEPEWTVDN